MNKSTEPPMNPHAEALTEKVSKIRAQSSSLPVSLQASTQQCFDAFVEACGENLSTIMQNEQIGQSMLRVWAISDFVAQLCVRKPQLLKELMESGDLFKEYAQQDCEQHLQNRLLSIHGEAELNTCLRVFRQREMLRIAWRDLAGWSELDETMNDLSQLAVACVQQALTFLQQMAKQRYGTPVDEEGNEQQLVVLAMGKLGANELNFSSDIDLIFTFSRQGNTQGASKSWSNEEFFQKLGRQLIAALNNVTQDGFVFRVDMRLRPFGDSGPLVMCFDAMENYYHMHGWAWERYAMIKAKCITGDKDAAEELMQILQPFIYRRYLDYGAYETIRDMKQRIVNDAQRVNAELNIKLGTGGIREIEFIGQAFQLIRGGRDKALQQRPIQNVLVHLSNNEYLPNYAVRELIAAYRFLRQLEHVLQEVADKQTHQLPTDENHQCRVAFAMQYADWESFDEELNKHRQRVHGYFQQVFDAPQITQTKVDGEETALAQVWNQQIVGQDALTILKESGFDQPQETQSLLQGLTGSARFRSLSAQGRQRLNTLMPLLLGAVGQCDDANKVLGRIIRLLEAVARRSSYLALLVENPMALSQLVKICNASQWISEQISKQPILLDELLDPRTLYIPPEKNELHADLASRMAQSNADDLEQQMEALRHFKHANVLRVAAADISESMPLMVVSDHLTDIAELILQQALWLAWQHLVARHGQPSLDRNSSHDKQLNHLDNTGFAVIAYGKLGGIELGYGSDLDLVFVYDGTQNGTTDGDKPVSNEVFYSRLGQRIIHILTAVMPSGILYEVDMRLRPSGASGLLVTHIDSFEDYQMQKAWTWEHQALVRARAVVGDTELIDRFTQIRHKVLRQERDVGKLREEVSTMRSRMRKQLLHTQNNQFDLKQGVGGIADIEFMVQYTVLASAFQNEALIAFTDNMRNLEAIQEVGLVNPQSVSLLKESYQQYRALVHRLTLQGKAAIVEDARFKSLRQQVQALWEQIFDD